MGKRTVGGKVKIRDGGRKTITYNRQTTYTYYVK